MRLYTRCTCGKYIFLNREYKTASDVRQQEGEIVTLRCPHCGAKVHRPYTSFWCKTWGPWLTIGILSAIILGAVALVVLLQQAGASIGAVIWIPLAALAVYAFLAKHESDSVERCNHSFEEAPSPRLTSEAAADFTDIELVDWFDIDQYDHITNQHEQVIFYASWFNYEEAPRYFEWYYYYEANEHDTPDDGSLLYQSLLAVGATRHAKIVRQAREIYLQNRAEIERCVRSVTHDGYQLLLSLNLFDKQDDATAEAYHTEPLLPLVAQYIREHIDQF
ncbi:MAG: hypothetical protein IJK84_04135 [Bacteroidales bacterium]|nr:hypothetical protein [Bacteroidales bacterium]